MGRCAPHQEDAPMTDPTDPNHDEPAEGPATTTTRAVPRPTAAEPRPPASPGERRPAQRRRDVILESLRDADRRPRRAGDADRQEFSVKAAELAATAADKAAPMARRPARRPPTRAASSPRSRGPGPPTSASSLGDATAGDAPRRPTQRRRERRGRGRRRRRPARPDAARPGAAAAARPYTSPP